MMSGSLPWYGRWGRERNREGGKPRGEKITRNWGSQSFVGLGRGRGSTPNSKTSGPFSFSVSLCTTHISPSFPPTFPSLHSSSIFSPVDSRLDIASLRQTNPATTAPLLQTSRISTQLSTQLSRWESFARKQDGESFPPQFLYLTRAAHFACR